MRNRPCSHSRTHGAAQASGRLAALDILHLCGKLGEDARSQRAAPDHAARTRAIRPSLDRAYAPAPEFLAPQGKTIVSRCAEITADQIRQSLTKGTNGPRQGKTATRAGMAPVRAACAKPLHAASLPNAASSTSTPASAARSNPSCLESLRLWLSHPIPNHQDRTRTAAPPVLRSLPISRWFRRRWKSARSALAKYRPCAGS